MPFLRLGRYCGWDVELLSNGAQMIVRYFYGGASVPVRGLVMGKLK